MIAQIIIPIAELVILTETRINEANAEIQTQPIIVEDRISTFST